MGVMDGFDVIRRNELEELVTQAIVSELDNGYVEWSVLIQVGNIVLGDDNDTLSEFRELIDKL